MIAEIEKEKSEKRRAFYDKVRQEIYDMDLTYIEEVPTIMVLYYQLMGRALAKNKKNYNEIKEELEFLELSDDQKFHVLDFALSSLGRIKYKTSDESVDSKEHLT